jgi:hypothetical protein
LIKFSVNTNLRTDTQSQLTTSLGSATLFLGLRVANGPYFGPNSGIFPHGWTELILRDVATGANLNQIGYPVHPTTGDLIFTIGGLTLGDQYELKFHVDGYHDFHETITFTSDMTSFDDFMDLPFVPLDQPDPNIQGGSPKPPITGQVEAVLSWGERPRDLDSQVYFPLRSGESRPTIVNYNRRFAPYYFRDVPEGGDASDTRNAFPVFTSKDDTDGWGPEYTRFWLHNLPDGFFYRFIVHKYAADDQLINESQAVVELVHAGEILETISMPMDAPSDFLYWYVCDIGKDESGNQTWNTINDLGPDPNLAEWHGLQVSSLVHDQTVFPGGWDYSNGGTFAWY